MAGNRPSGRHGLSSRRPLRIRSVISGVTTFSVLVRIRIFVFAFGTTIFLDTTPGCAGGSAARPAGGWNACRCGCS